MKKRVKWIAVYLLIAAAVAVISYSMAAYTSLSSAKRVITVSDSEQYFTSDILVQYDPKNPSSSLQSRVKSFGKNDTTRTFSVTVSNHLQSYLTEFDKKNIAYTFSATLVDANGSAVTDNSLQGKLKVNEEDMMFGTDGGYSYTKTSHLAGGKAQDDTYTFTITDDAILNYQLKITANPMDRDEYKPLGRLIILATDTTSTNWTGDFLETEKNAVNANKTIALLNYRISGHVEEECVLCWNASRIEIDKWFLEQMNIKEKDIETDKNGMKSVKLHLGVAGTPQQYTIQFYRTYAVNDLAESEKETWDTIETYVKFTNSKGE